MPHSTVRITVDRGGGVVVFSGASDIGQGSDTMLAVVAAETLGIAPSQVTVVSADTDLTPVDLGTYSSRVTFMAGNACLEAAAKIRDRLLAAVADEVEVHVDGLEIRDGLIDGPDILGEPLGFAEAVVLAESRGDPVEASGGYTPPEMGGSYRGAGVGPSAAYSFSAHAAEVEVDLETGQVEVVRLVASHDLGVALNPLAAEGQVEGGASMGLGEALMEDYGVLEGGQLVAPSLLEYHIPTAVDLPDLETILVESVDPNGPYGAKECGEGSVHPTIPAVVNAVHDAVGVWLHEVPISPEAILAGLKRREAASVSPSTGGRDSVGAARTERTDAP
jgi:CO/xanthine dehydrogenase Mo-binding subunit